MERQKRIQKRWVRINNIFIALLLVVLMTVLVREFISFRRNIDFFNDKTREFAIHEIEHEVNHRVQQINSEKGDINTHFKNELQDIVRLVDYYASVEASQVDSNATLEEKRAAYIESIYQYDISEDEYLFFAMDLDGVSYLSGLTKNLEGTNISFLQDEITGRFFVLDMIDTIEQSETMDGFVTYYWIKELGGEHLKKTSYIYYNEEVDLFLGTGLYDVDYTASVQEELFKELATYYSGDDYIYVFSYEGDIIYYPDEDFTKEDLLSIQTTQGRGFHETIIDELQDKDSTFIEYTFHYFEDNQKKTGYVHKIEDWEIYIGKSFVDNELDLEEKLYMDSILNDVIIYNTILIVFIIVSVFFIKRLTSENFEEVKVEFEEKNSAVKKATYIDYLTGLYNRHYFDEVVNNVCIDCQSRGVIMADANGLKLINDAYGHKYGDEVLVTIANLFKKIFSNSYIFRWGGDEFIILTSNVKKDEIHEKVERFHKELGDITIKNVQLSAAVGHIVTEDQSSNIFDLINEAEKRMYDHKMHSSISMKRSIVDNVLNTLYNNFNFEKDHSENVMKYAVLIGEELQLPKDEMNRLRLGALMHDVGKIGIPDNILNKPEKLSEDDIEEIQKHPEKGFRILSAYPELSEYGNIVLNHHEWYDGSGYPRGIQGEEIPLYSRIISVADAFDAMTAQRVYKKSLSKEQALQEIKAYSGRQFDPMIVDAFVKKVTNNL